MGSLLLDNYPLIVLPELACAVGLNEAIILQQIHYWIEHNRKNKHNFHDGRYWVYNSYSEWQKQFPWWTVITIKRTIGSLEKMGLLVSGNFNASKMDRTKWYSINYEKLKSLFPSYQNDTMESIVLTQPIPETTKTYKEDNNIRKEQSEGLPSTLFSKSDSFGHINQDNIFHTTIERYGRKRAEYMLSVVDWYIDKAYPAYTNNQHPEETRAKRMVFAEKLLKCSDDTVCDDQFIAETIYRAIKECKDCDPTIYYITTPKVLGYWIIQDEDVGYESVNDTEYAPVEAIY